MMGVSDTMASWVAFVCFTAFNVFELDTIVGQEGAPSLQDRHNRTCWAIQATRGCASALSVTWNDIVVVALTSASVVLWYSTER